MMLVEKASAAREARMSWQVEMWTEVRVSRHKSLHKSAHMWPGSLGRTILSRERLRPHTRNPETLG